MMFKMFTKKTYRMDEVMLWKFETLSNSLSCLNFDYKVLKHVRL